MTQYRDLDWPDQPKQGKDKAEEQAKDKDKQEEKN